MADNRNVQEAALGRLRTNLWREIVDWVETNDPVYNLPVPLVECPFCREEIALAFLPQAPDNSANNAEIKQCGAMLPRRGHIVCKDCFYEWEAMVGKYKCGQCRHTAWFEEEEEDGCNHEELVREIPAHDPFFSIERVPDTLATGQDKAEFRPSKHGLKGYVSDTDTGFSEESDCEDEQDGTCRGDEDDEDDDEDDVD